MRLLAIGVVSLLLCPRPAAAAERLDLAFGGDAWRTETKGPFTVQHDRRGVLTVTHSDAPAKAGEFAAVSRLLDVPPGLHGPLVLRFYLTDDYVGDKEQPVFFRDAVKERVSDWKEAVRFEQVLIEDVVVWSKDTLGPNGTTAGSRFYDLEISELVAKKTQVKLTFRVRDDADTGDATFPIQAFWARPELLWGFGAQPPAVEFPPRLPFRREQFRPTAPPAPLSGRVALTLKNPSGVALRGWPIRWGVPLPAGAVKNASQLALSGPEGELVPLQAQVTARWPDGTAKWVLLDFVAPLAKAEAAYALRYGAEVSGAQDGAVPSGTPATKLQAGDVQAAWGAGAALPTLSAGAMALAPPTEALPAVELQTERGTTLLRAVAKAPPELISRGPVRSDAHSRAEYRDAGGRVLAASDLSFSVCAGVPALFVRHTLEVGGAKGGLRLRELRLPLLALGSVGTVGVSGASRPVPAGPWVLRQEGEDRVALGPLDSPTVSGGKWDGWALGEGTPRALVCLRWPWEQFPNGLRSGPEGLSLQLLDLGAAKDALAVAPGEAKSHEFMLYVGGADLTAERAAQLSAVFQKPPVIVFQPGWIAATNVLGPFVERDTRRFPEYEAAASGVAAGIAQERASQHAYGFEDYGDSRFQWGFGETLTYWSNTEYDHAHALLWQFLRTGDPELFYEGCRAALHYRDVDLIHANDEHPDWIGGAHHHAETHTKDGPTISHHWTEGLFDHYLLTGDTRSLECGRLAADYAQRVAEHSGYSGSEREAGWNLIALMGAYRATGDAALLRAANKKIDDVLAYLDPVRGVSSGRIYEQSAYEGGTPFMAGILMRGLTMAYDETHDERVGWAISGLCDWLACEMMPAPGRFAYKQAPQLRQAGPLLLALDGVAFAWNFTGDPVYRRLALDVYREGVGSADLTNMRDMPHALALLATALPPVAVRQVEVPLLLSTGSAGEAAFSLANLTERPLPAEVKVTPLGPNAPAPVTVLAGVPATDGWTTTRVGLPVGEATTGVARFRYSVSVGSQEAGAGEFAVLRLPRPPRLLLLAPEDNLTTRALTLLQVPFARREAGEFALTMLQDRDLLVCGFDVGTASLRPDAAALAEWVKAGGVVVAFRGDAASAGWLPSPVKQDASYQPGAILKPDSPPFALLHSIGPEALAGVHGGSMYRAFYDLGEGWQPLAATGPKQAWDATKPASPGPHYGLVELPLGQGRVILCQLVPEYAWLHDDAGRSESEGRGLLENLLGYACLSAAR